MDISALVEAIDTFVEAIDIEASALISGALLLWVALVQVVMAAGSRSGDLVWSGHQPRRLDPVLRVRSLLYAVMVVASVVILAGETGLIDILTIPDRWSMSATFVVTAFLGVITIHHIGWGSRWERLLFAPITFLGALLAGWLTFA
ncbi:MAG TPA: hypothetical protein VGB33_02745 [Acidimicrobiia bacterium]|jgi:hypothetical protein